VTLTFGLFFACGGGDTIDQVVTITGVATPGGVSGGGAAGAGTAGSGTAARSGGAAGGNAGNENGGTNPSVGAGNSSGASGDSGVAGETGLGGASSISGAGGDAGSAEMSGNAGAPSAGSPSGGSGGGFGHECTSELQCGNADLMPCRRAACNDGVCGTVVDQNRVPPLANVCMLGTCNKFGEAGQEPGPAGKSCTGQNGEKLCDAFGRCVQCLHSSDCADGKVCSAARRCVSATCTDVDCGGNCPPCDNGKTCQVDADCASNACDDVGHTCVANQCHDQRQNGDETDADCGGSTCPKCANGKSCILSSDCMYDACDLFKLVCVNWQCGDHRKDGPETDVDCGGQICNACLSGQTCASSLDCQAGHLCVDKVCQ
jgi:Cys-rich repeat protein